MADLDTALDPLRDLPVSEYPLFHMVAAFGLERLAGAVDVEAKLSVMADLRRQLEGALFVLDGELRASLSRPASDPLAGLFADGEGQL
ncbi:hypothetical protein [Modestobacter sp. KNN46-3]|uniref:hypothetical protein n=1 Tax=Modestobacter sp. KNN46-3 TaxID=2711218 RepID=UPI0013DF5145|nr:hypothetical protein [Modestobacter sp. KNN46-3]